VAIKVSGNDTVVLKSEGFINLINPPLASFLFGLPLRATVKNKL
jgi:hypothetical protein